MLVVFKKKTVHLTLFKDSKADYFGETVAIGVGTTAMQRITGSKYRDWAQTRNKSKKSEDV